MSGDVIGALEDLRSAIESDGTASALDALDDLADAYESLAAAERPRIERAKVVTRATAGDEPGAALSFLEETTTAQLNRAGALVALRSALAYPERTDEDPAALVETLLERERTVAAAGEAAADRLAEVSLPALPVVVSVSTPEGPVGKGSTADVSATVLNAGDEPATGLSATVEVPDGLAVVDGATVANELAPRESTTVTATLRAEAAGDHVVTVEVTGDPDRDAVETDQVEVLAKGGFVDRVGRQLDLLRSRVEEASPPSGGQQRQLLAKLDAAADSVERAEDHVERGQAKQANDALTAASRQVGAFVNAVEATGGGNRLPEDRRVAFAEAAADVVDLLAAARDAAI